MQKKRTGGKLTAKRKKKKWKNKKKGKQFVTNATCNKTKAKQRRRRHRKTFVKECRHSYFLFACMSLCLCTTCLCVALSACLCGFGLISFSSIYPSIYLFLLSKTKTVHQCSIYGDFFYFFLFAFFASIFRLRVTFSIFFYSSSLSL